MGLSIFSLEAALVLGDREAVAFLAPLVAPAASLSAVLPVNSTPARVLGDAAALLGEMEQARAYYLQALENCAKIGFRPEAALAHLGLAELGLGAGGTGQENPAPTGGSSADPGVVGARSTRPRPQPTPQERAEAIRHLDIAIREFRDMKMQPSLERALKHRELLKA